MATMQAHGRPHPARLLAPLALLAFCAALAMVILGSGVFDEEATDSAGARDLPSVSQGQQGADRPERRGPARYTIKANDTLTGIAAQTGTTVERLQELNPELDPQGLVAGQRIKLRE
jgi:LysM domain